MCGTGALTTGELDADRMGSYRKLERELRAIEARSNKRVGRELKRRWKTRARETRQERKYGKSKRR